MIAIGQRLLNLVWRRTQEPVDIAPLYKSDNLEVRVEGSPIVGYRGPAGTLVVSHQQNKLFTEWSPEELQELADITNKFLQILEEQQKVSNVLLYGKQVDGEFTFSIVPYPKCDWSEKILGAIDAIFGARALKSSEIDAIEEFYERGLKAKIERATPPPQTTQNDPFCNEAILAKQRVGVIAPKLAGAGTYDILQDIAPKVFTKKDPHLLIVPKGAQGHVDGSNVTPETRRDLLVCAREMMRLFRREGYQNFAYLERNGKLLQGIQHKTAHAMAFSKVPTTIWGKICLFTRFYVWTPKLSTTELQNSIKRWAWSSQ